MYSKYYYDSSTCIKPSFLRVEPDRIKVEKNLLNLSLNVTKGISFLSKTDLSELAAAPPLSHDKDLVFFPEKKKYINVFGIHPCMRGKQYILKHAFWFGNNNQKLHEFHLSRTLRN